MGSTDARIEDVGPMPQSFDIERATNQNSDYRSVAWSGRYLQVTLMSIPVGGDIGLEAHPEIDQFLRLEMLLVTSASSSVSLDALTMLPRLFARHAIPSQRPSGWYQQVASKFHLKLLKAGLAHHGNDREEQNFIEDNDSACERSNSHDRHS